MAKYVIAGGDKNGQQRQDLKWFMVHGAYLKKLDKLGKLMFLIQARIMLL